MTTTVQQVAAMPLLRRKRAARLPTPERRRAIRDEAGVSREEMARELRARGVACTEGAIKWWEMPKDEGGFDPRPAKAIPYRRLLEEIAADTAKVRAAQGQT